MLVGKALHRVWPDLHTLKCFRIDNMLAVVPIIPPTNKNSTVIGYRILSNGSNWNKERRLFSIREPPIRFSTREYMAATSPEEITAPSKPSKAPSIRKGQR